MSRWLAWPLRDIEQSNQRHAEVYALTQSQNLRSNLELTLSQIGDPERIAAKIAALRVNPRGIVQLGRSLNAAKSTKRLIENNPELQGIYERISVEEDLIGYIANHFVEEPATTVGRGAIIAEGIDADLDELRALSKNRKDYLVDMAAREGERPGIPILKMASNNVLGSFC